MTIRLIGIADLHINERSRHAESEEVRSWMAYNLPDLKPDAYLIGGDLIHGRSTIVERESAMRFLRPLDDSAEVVGIYGNHEVPGDLGIYSALRRTRFYAEPTVHMLPGLPVACLPWLTYVPSPADLRLPPSAVAENAARSIAARVEALREELAMAVFDTPDMPRVMLGHAMIRGAKTALGQPIPLGAEFELGLSDLATFGADAYLFGHVHAGQEWVVNAGAPVIYPGSPHRTTYGEIEEKRVALITLEGRDATIEYIPTPARPMFLVEVTWTPDAWANDPAVTQLLADVEEARPLPPDVRLRYLVPSSRREQGATDAERLATKLKKAGAFRVKPEPIVITEAAVRADTVEVAQAASLHDQLAILLQRQGKDDPTRARLLSRFDKLQTQRDR